LVGRGKRTWQGLHQTNKELAKRWEARIIDKSGKLSSEHGKGGGTPHYGKEGRVKLWKKEKKRRKKDGLDGRENRLDEEEEESGRSTKSREKGGRGITKG